jgi:hypothetical protein
MNVSVVDFSFLPWSIREFLRVTGVLDIRREGMGHPDT